MKKITTIVLLALLLVSCGATGPGAANDRAVAIASITGSSFRGHMEILAADDMEGREAGTEGFDRAADYVAGQYQLAGLAPMGDNGTYFQAINFLETRLVPGSAIMSLQKGGAGFDLAFSDDFLRSGGYGPADEEITAPLVFVGHGIYAPEYNHDDFSEVEVSGKIMVVLSGAPPQFDTDQRAFYSSGSGKQAVAAERGAVGIITVRTPVDQARRPWKRFLSSIGTPGMRWIDRDGTLYQGFPQLAGRALLSSAGAEKLFALSVNDLEQLFEKHASGETGSFDMGVTATLARRSLQRTVTSANVIGLIRGSDPLLQNEYVVFTAHLDHLGIRPGEDGDDIHNGAYDNTAGVAAVLEIASAMVAMDRAPRRTIIFAAVTGEEKGMQGSSYFARNPTVPAAQLVANINIDMPYLGFPVSDIEAFGAEHSTLLAAVKEATTEIGMDLTPDPMPERVRFVRSDQFAFVKEGIPALAFKAGAKSSDPEIDGGAMLADFLENHYHRASDDLKLPFSAEGAERFAQTALLLGLIVADQEARPVWNTGDFFGVKYGK